MENTNIIRVTKAQKFEAIRAMIPADASKLFLAPSDSEKESYTFSYEEIMAFLDNEIKLVSKKNTNSRVNEAAQAETEAFLEDIRDYLLNLPDDQKGATCTDIWKGTPSLFNSKYSTSKVTSLMRILLGNNEVAFREEKGKKYYYMVWGAYAPRLGGSDAI